MFPSFLNCRWWETATPLYRKEVCDRAGPWTDLSLEEDWEYDCRIASLGGRLVYCPQPVSEHRDHAGTRLSRGQALNAQRLGQRARAHALVFQHALAFGITSQQAEMQQFSRSLFLLSRQCGAAGLAMQAKELFQMAREAAGGQRGQGADFRIYRVLANLFGWVRMGRWSVWLDTLRSGVSA